MTMVLLIVLISVIVTVKAQEACDICGTGFIVTFHEHIYEFPGQPVISCGMLEQAGQLGLFPDKEACTFVQNDVNRLCGCRKIPTLSPSSGPSTSLLPTISAPPSVSSHPTSTPTESSLPSSPPSFSSSPSEYPTTAMPSLSDAPSVSISPSQCTSLPGFEHHHCGYDYLNEYCQDSDVRDCEWYSIRGHCEKYGHERDKWTHVTAREGCCACGGGNVVFTSSPTRTPSGSSLPSTFPSIFPSALPSSSSFPSKRPSILPSALPSTSSMPSSVPSGSSLPSSTARPSGSSFPSNFPSMLPSPIPSGSSIPSNFPSKVPSVLPSVSSLPSSTPSTMAPTRLGCQDVPGWYDSNRRRYDCDWYTIQDCRQFGHAYENFGLTANEACCVCDGGSTRASAPVISPVK